MGTALEIFYRPGDAFALQKANAWVNENDIDFCGHREPPTFATADHRWNWVRMGGLRRFRLQLRGLRMETL